MRTRAAFLTIASLAITVVMLWFGFASVSPVWAQAQQQQKTGENLSSAKKGIETVKDIETAVEKGDSNLENHSYSTFNILLGTIALETFGSAKTDGSSLGDNSPFKQGIVAQMGGLIGEMYGNPPANTQTYVAYMLDSTGIIATPAYAQGIGFSALSPVLKAWTTFRNLAYLCFVVIFLVVGFMIMFRQKIGSQTAVTAQQALPRMVMALIFVTFSYAIAGLLIDLMYLIMYMMIGVFGFEGQETAVLGGNFINVARLLLSGNLVGTTFETVQTFVSSGLGSTDGSAGLSVVLGTGVGLIAVVVLAIAVIYAMFDLFFELLRTYATIMISIVTAPISIMLDALPGKNAFASWLKNLIANLAAFPAVLMVLIIYDQITSNITGSGSGEFVGGGFTPPFLGGGGTGEAMTFLLGLALLPAITAIVKTTKKSLGATDQFGWFTSAVKDTLQSGWTGNKNLIPGLGFTNLSKSPLTSWAGGLSGENFNRKLLSTAAIVPGGAFNVVKNAALGGEKRETSLSAFIGGGLGAGARTALFLGGDKQLLTQDQKRIAEERKNGGKSNDKH